MTQIFRVESPQAQTDMQKNLDETLTHTVQLRTQRGLFSNLSPRLGLMVWMNPVAPNPACC